MTVKGPDSRLLLNHCFITSNLSPTRPGPINIHANNGFLLKTMTTIEDKNIPSRRGQHLIQVQSIYSLQFVTMMKKNMTTTTKILDRIFNVIGPGLPHNEGLLKTSTLLRSRIAKY